MSLGISRVREPSNEVVRSYAPGSAERASLEAECKRQTSEVIDIPCVINGKRLYTGNTVDVIMPSDRHHVLAKLHMCGPMCHVDITGLVVRRLTIVIIYSYLHVISCYRLLVGK